MMAKRNGIQISLVFAPIRVGAPDHPSVQPGIRAAESWRGLRFTEFELRRLDAGEKTWTPNARPLLPDQTGHPSLVGGAQPLHWLVFITAAGTGRNRPLANPNPAI
jgi:hypothetical protein